MKRPDCSPTLLLHVPLPTELHIKKPASAFAFRPDDTLLLTVHEEEGGILWDLTMAAPPQKLDFKQDQTFPIQPVKSVVLLGASGGFVLAFGTDHPAQHYEIINESPGFRVAKHTLLPAANDVAMSQDGKTIAFSTGTTVEVWDGTGLRRNRVLSPTVIPRSPFQKVAISEDSKYTAAVDSTGQLTVWDITNDFRKVSPDQEFALDLGSGWQPTSIGLDNLFAMAVLRNSPPPGQQPDWTLVKWGFAYQGPDRTFYHQDFPPCAQACIPPSPDFTVALTTQGQVMGKDAAMFPIFCTSAGASKKGKVVSCSISGSSKMLAAARSNGRLTVWRLYTKEVDPSIPLLDY